jgi:hypothetical protein
MPFNIMYVHPAGIQCTLIAANIPDLDAAKITSGVFDEARIPKVWTHLDNITIKNDWPWYWFWDTGGAVDKKRCAFAWNDAYFVIARFTDAGAWLSDLIKINEDGWISVAKADASLIASGVLAAARVAPDVLTTQGDILIRGAAGYERLGVGVSGQFLKTQGAGANPKWDTAGGVPSGVICMWHGLIANIPDGWVLCDGAGGTPDLRAKFVRGAPAATEAGGVGGEDTHVLTVAELAAHTHNIKLYNQSSTVGNYPEGTNSATTTKNMLTDSAGGGAAHENRPAYYQVLFIMKS